MAKLTINVELNSAQAKTGLNELKEQMSTIVAELNKVSVSKDLNEQINSLAKMYKEMAAAAKESYKTVTAEEDKAEQSAAKTATAVGKLVEQYGKLQAKLTDIKTKSTSTDYSELEKQIQTTAESVTSLSNAFKENGSLTQEQREQLRSLQVQGSELSATLEKMAAADKELAKAARDAARAAQEQDQTEEESSTSFNKTINAVESLRKQYADLLRQLQTLEQQYPENTFTDTTKEIRECYTEVQQLSTGLKESSSVSEEQSATLAKLQTSYKTLSADVAQLREQENKLNSTEPLQPNYLTTLTQVQKQYATLLTTLSNTEKYYKKGTFTEYTAQLQSGLSAITNLNTAYQTTGTLTAEQQAKLEQLIALYKQLSAEISATTASQKSMHGSLTDLISGFAKFQASAMLVMKPLQLIRSALSSINETLVETEDAIIEIQRVLSEDVSNSEISSTLYDLAQEYGQTFDNVSEIATNFIKSGLSWDEAIEATEAALLALNVAELDAEEASEGLIAILTQFGYEASDLTYIVDVLNKTADNAAVTTEELLEALQKCGSYASAANLSLEETVAIITALSEATAASGSNLGTAVKSLLSYTTKASSLSVFADLSDDMANVVALYQTGAASILDVWEQLAVEMQDLTAEQADLLSQWSEDTGLEDELADELSDIYDSLTGVYDTAGTYRKNYFIALLNNMDEVEYALETLSDAAGYSAEENETYLESYTAKLNTLQAHWEELASSEEGWLKLKKTLVSTGDEILTLIEYTGGLTTTLTALSAIVMTLFGKDIILKISTLSTKMGGLRSSALNIVGSFKNLKATEKEVTTATQELAAAKQNLQAATTSASSAEEAQTAKENAQMAVTEAETKVTQANTAAKQAQAAAIASVISYALIAITVIQSIVGAIQSAQEAAEEAAKEAQEAINELISTAASATDTYTSASATLKDYVDQIKELQESTDDTTTVQSELLEIQNKLISLNEEYADSIDLVNGNLDEEISKIEELGKSELRNWLFENQTAIQEAQELVSSTSTSSSLTDSQTAMANILEAAAAAGIENIEAYIGGETVGSTIGDILSAYTGVQFWENIAEGQGIGEAFLNWYGAIFSGNTYTTQKDYGVAFSGTTTEILESIRSVYDYIEEYGEELGFTEDEIKEYLSYLSDYYNELNTTEYQEAVETAEYAQKIQDYLNGVITWEEFLGEAVSDTTSIIEDEADAIASLSSSALEKLIAALEEARDLQDDSLTLEEKKLAVLEAEEALENAKNTRSVRTLNAETGQWEYVANQGDVEDAEADLQDAIDALNEYVEEQAWDDVIDELESGNATTDSILEILTGWLAESYGDETPDWLDTIIGTIENQIGEDISGNDIVGSYDSGGIASGLGLMAKATSLPETVNNPELTSKILSPVSNSQFDKYVQDMGLLFETARQYDNASNGVVQAMGNTTNNSTDNSITINGVSLGSDMGNRSLNELISMLSLIPKN